MSFFDQYEDIGGGSWVTAAEKQVMMDEGIPFSITGVVDDPENQYGPRYVAKILLPNPETGEEEERNIGFPIGKVESRNRMLAQMKTYLDGEDAEPVVCKLEKVGQSIIIRQA